jgi:hypothetical protein
MMGLKKSIIHYNYFFDVKGIKMATVTTRRTTTNSDVLDKLNEGMVDITTALDIDVESIKTEGLTIRAGTRMYKLQLVSDDPVSIADEIRKEYKDILNQKLDVIKTTVQSRVNEMSSLVTATKDEYIRKEEELKRRLETARIMPEIPWRLAERGLSVSLGDNNRNSYIWHFRGIYWPKTIDSRKIDPKFAKKLVTPIIFLVSTQGKNVTGVSTRTLDGLRFFDHYHQATPDCWGRWVWRHEWEKPEDIITIALEAQAVLENINTGSIARRNPAGLPTINTLRKYVVSDNVSEAIITDTIERLGVRPPNPGQGPIAPMENDEWVVTLNRRR